MNVMCDKCQNVFEPVTINRKKKDKIITYFECPECSEQYVSAVITGKIKLMQGELNDMIDEYNKKGIQDWQPIYDLQKEIKKAIRKEKRALDG